LGLLRSDTRLRDGIIIALANQIALFGKLLAHLIAGLRREKQRQDGEDEALWRIAGLVHDIDYEEHPTIEEHALVGSGWLRELWYPDVLVQAVLARFPVLRE